MIFPLRLFPGIGYYAAMYGCREVSFDTYARYNKADKDTHRFAIADTRGLLRLTVPVSRPSGARTWHEINVSDHGRWWETMPIALESAYGRTPYFEFYIDRLMPLFSPEPIAVSELCLHADKEVRRILDIRALITDIPPRRCCLLRKSRAGVSALLAGARTRTRLHRRALYTRPYFQPRPGGAAVSRTAQRG